MVFDLFCYDMVLIALVWLCVMLHRRWPRDRTTVHPTLPPRQRREPKAFEGFTNPYQADDVKRANRCIAGAGRPSEEQLVKPSFQAVATDLISVAGHSPCAAPNTSRGSMFSPPLRGEQWFSQKPRPRNTCV